MKEMYVIISMFIKDTKSKSIKKVYNKTQSPIKIYTCGPTVYDHAHIGNFRTFIWEDLLIRTLKYGACVKFIRVMNITDVDDKTIKNSIKNNCTLEQYTSKYSELFKNDCKTLNIYPADFYPKATDFIDEMINMISTLDTLGKTYNKNGNIYFNISKFPKYGSFKCCSYNEDISQGDTSDDKAGDFVLWKAWDQTRDGNIFWESPWGKGRPGWHIECSAMIHKLLGESIDIHAGGIDNMFPHHENEIAQSECLFSVPLSDIWMHVEHLMVDGKKMSKTLGNFYTANDLIKLGYKGEEIRFALMSGHYSTSVNFTKKSLEDARISLNSIRETLNRLKFYKTYSDSKCNSINEEIQEFKTSFLENMMNDLKLAQSLAIVFNAMNKINEWIDSKSLSKHNVEEINNVINYFSSIIGIDFIKKVEIPQDVLQLANLRLEERKNKNWELSDSLRKEIEDKGFFIIDEGNSYRITKK